MVIVNVLNLSCNLTKEFDFYTFKISNDKTFKKLCLIETK